MRPAVLCVAIRSRGNRLVYHYWCAASVRLLNGFIGINLAMWECAWASPKAHGATDNAAGSAVMLEAARLIQTLRLQPEERSGAHLGLARKRAAGFTHLCKEHFSTFENPKPEFAKLECISMSIPVSTHSRGVGRGSSEDQELPCVIARHFQRGPSLRARTRQPRRAPRS